MSPFLGMDSRGLDSFYTFSDYSLGSNSLFEEFILRVVDNSPRMSVIVDKLFFLVLAFGVSGGP